ncbi:hypothetical protein BCR32DRAFT_295185 [Anaeromyces robustus]|uniref:Uncharacterized protein n=1 Tax=Anaeromyces robustus TaxID=1754192 RepID=A0A1Y1WX76_9FUNG|nr:hypothetical protein BCR32DRAFT_295185 [Anaeromyces robustus]|eukprot:ORX78159.1 hypothetical protein BCR32DRAFT_295185 [Anaeromyces robustus]
MRSNISPTSGPNGLKFRYGVALEQSFPMSIKSKRSGGNLQYLYMSRSLSLIMWGAAPNYWAVSLVTTIHMWGL